MPKNFMDNTLKRKLKNKEKVAGSWIHSGSAVTAGIIANAGFDFGVIDMEHSPIDYSNLPSVINEMNGTDCIPIVRAPWNDIVSIKRILDCGAYGIHIPFVQTVEEAKNAVKYCKYPPQGLRGAAGCTNASRYNLRRNEYFERANEEIMVIIAIENLEGASNAEAFSQIEGVDGIFIGPSDLGASMGYLNKKSDEVEAVIRDIEKVVLKSDKFLGTIANNNETAKILYDRGYNYVIMMSDMVDLASIAKQRVENFQKLKNDL